MNGGADLGGMMGFGPVVQEANEPIFHEPWEARALGMVVALGACGQWNLDMSRFARESMNPADYMKASYYSIWIEAAVRLMIDREMISEDEIAAGASLSPPHPIKNKLEAADVDTVLFAGGPADRPQQGQPKFSVGDRIRTNNNHPTTHTRMARYARDKAGSITKIHGFHVFPDSSSQGNGEDPQWLYQVTFTSRTLWGDDGNDVDTISLDLWEPYIKANT
jgi:nitrile hydratase